MSLFNLACSSHAAIINTGLTTHRFPFSFICFFFFNILSDVMKWPAFDKDYSVARQFFGALSGCSEYTSIYTGVALLQHWDTAGHGILKAWKSRKTSIQCVWSWPGFNSGRCPACANVLSWSLNLGKLGCRTLAGWCNSISSGQTCVVSQNSWLAFTVAKLPAFSLVCYCEGLPQWRPRGRQGYPASSKPMAMCLSSEFI